MTPDFLDRIEKSPVLRKAFQDERFLVISQELARDPVNTMKKVSQHMPEFLDALREFTALIGDQMTKKAEEMEAPKLDASEQALVDRVMKEPAVQVSI
jgi:hypothetical protein